MDPSEDSTVESEDAVEGRRGMSSASSFDRPESDDIDLAGSPGIAFAVFFSSFQKRETMVCGVQASGRKGFLRGHRGGGNSIINRPRDRSKYLGGRYWD